MGKDLMIIGEKESFLIRALVKKLAEKKISSYYCGANVSDIGRKKAEQPLMVYYMNDGETIAPDVIHYLKEILTDTGTRMLLIGDKADTDEVKKSLNPALIAECFPRPLNTDLFVDSIKDLFKETAVEKEKKRILVVDDDTEFLAVVREWLKGKYQVIMANSGMQAIKLLGAGHVDLILLDYEMPVTTGPQVLEMIRSDADTAMIPVVFLTGRGDKKSVMAVLDLKPEGYILKASGKAALMAKVDEFFAK